jgi:hypothetical protein
MLLRDQQLVEACEPIRRDDPALAARVLDASREIAVAAWEAGLKNVELWNNHEAHEFRVWRQTVRIAWASGHDGNPAIRLTFNDLLILCVCCFFHDLYAVRRVAEEAIEQASEEDKVLKNAQKILLRLEHMAGGAKKAKEVLIGRPDLISPADLRRAVGLIAMHDMCKVGCPWPLISDSLAVYFFEGDVLWPLDPEFGPLADLQRKGVMEPDWATLREQAESNLKTQLLHYPKASFDSVMEEFRGGTLMRTAEGARILAEHLRYWQIEPPAGLL